jgi:pilus assembly protein CpaE
VYPLTLALIAPEQSSRDEAELCLRDLQARVVVLQREYPEWGTLLQRIEQERPDLVLVDFAAFPQPWDELVQRIKSVPVPPMVIALHKAADPETILNAIRSGATEYVYPPLATNLRKALERLSQEWERQRAEGGTQGRTLAFFSAKGGCGATTIACQLSIALQRVTKSQVLLADFDLAVGMVSFLMRTKSRYSLLDALQNTHRLDLSYWKALVSNGVPGLEIIPAPGGTELIETPPAEKFRHVLRFARLHYDWVLVDLGRSLSISSLSLLDEIDEVYLVATSEVPSLYQVKRTAETLTGFGFSHDRLKLLLNRVPKSLDVTSQELQNLLGIPVHTMLPDDYNSLYEAYGAGQPLQPGSTLGRHLHRLAARIAGIPEEKKGKKFLLFG